MLVKIYNRYPGNFLCVILSNICTKTVVLCFVKVVRVCRWVNKINHLTAILKLIRVPLLSGLERHLLRSDGGRGPEFESRLGKARWQTIYTVYCLVYTWLKTMEHAYTTEFPDTINTPSCYPITVNNGDQLWIQPHTSACPRATQHGCTKCWRLHHHLVGSNHREKSWKKAEKKNLEVSLNQFCFV